MPIPSPPLTQALSSSTFRPPHLDGSMPLTATYDWHESSTPSHRLFVFSTDDGSIRTIYWPEAVTAVWTGARLISKLTSHIALNRTPVVAIVAMSDTISYFTTMMSVMRANCIVFPISPRNSAQAVAHLISEVNVDHILMGHENSMHGLVNEALTIVKLTKPTTFVPEVSLAPLFEDLFVKDPVCNGADLPLLRQGPDDIILYLHSSGSTAFPKPVPWTNYRFSQLALIPWFGSQDLCDKIFSLHVMPMYHGMGILQLCWTASCGLVLAAFQPKSPATSPTPENLFKAAKSTASDIMFCVPSFIEAWAKIPEYVNWLSTRTGVLFGGGPLNKTVGDFLTIKGVSIFILYGSTEGGIMSPILPARAVDWEYFQFPSLVNAHMVPHGDNTFELVMVSNQFCRPSVLNTIINGVEAYATSDLFVAHPTLPNYWRVFGRSDDQIIHNTGEKTNPGPLENMMNQDPHVAAAVMFGRGQFQVGLIVEPNPPFRFDPGDLEKLSEFRSEIWPTVEEMNKFAPQHSRLFKEMILVANPKKPFTYTAKNTARRQAILNDYETEIQKLYDAVEESSQPSIPAPPQWNQTTTKIFIRAVVEKVLAHAVNDEDDIFQHGCDSLQATWIRNSLHRVLNDDVEIDIRQSPGNFVYDHPTINLLTQYIFAIASGNGYLNMDRETDSLKLMEQMVQKYSTVLPDSTIIAKINKSSSEKIVVLTGSTGAFGAHILCELLKDPHIKLIYALNRKGAHSILERQQKVFKDKALGQQAEAINSGRVVLIDSDITANGLGVNSQLYQKIADSVTHVIHSAWRVDFNLGLSSFASQIKGLRNLIDLCIECEAALIFTSSIGVLQAVPENAELPCEAPVPASYALSNGYTQSKWVAEKVLENAHRKSGLRFLNVRVGQLTGGINGAWNIKEWVPTMIQASSIIGCIPIDHRNISWIPVHHAAAALVDFIDIPTSNGPHHLHLLHSNPVPWTSLATNIASELKLEVVEYQVWLHRLTTSKGTTDFQLLGFFKQIHHEMFGKNKEAFGMPKAENELGLASSKFLRERLGVIEDKEVKKWLKYWKHAGII
ncbi:hypothetical protein C8R41DRAFT_845764 [Lentinula lateritia]|uniref:Carrier domain-containing protein n=1 Tax=Lentinula lateritia TaxID=40482 RepID=A0ABQ8V6D7_9AGAR|nr:hypothetical protein C8R41DRAFT_845764 [Lentinula lateritia]